MNECLSRTVMWNKELVPCVDDAKEDMEISYDIFILVSFCKKHHVDSLITHLNVRTVNDRGKGHRHY